MAPESIKWWQAVSRQKLLLSNHNSIKQHDTLYKDFWLSVITSPESTLRNYATFKTTCDHEKYLSDVTNISHRFAITRLRTSSHSLRIETGRYCNPKLPVKERLCFSCKQIENECHFLTKCAMYQAERTQLFDNVSKLCPRFLALNDEQKCLFLLTAEGDIIRETGKFAEKAFVIRNALLYPENQQRK